MSKDYVKVNARPVAQRYAGAHEQILEVSSSAGGCLISIRLVGDDLNRLVVDVYNKDEDVSVLQPAGE